MGRFTTRSLQREIMDDQEPDRAAVDEIYAFLAMANRRFGGVRATLRRFEQFSRAWQPNERIDVLDLASGAADLPRALIAWGRRRGFDLRVTAVDLSMSALDHARRAGTTDERLHLVRADVRLLPWPDRAFDYVTSALFFHHLPDRDVTDLLTRADDLARRGLVINDLVRSPRAWMLTWLLTWPFHPILHHDGPLSVRRAFTPDELLALARDAGLDWVTVQRHVGERMTLAGERPGPARSLPGGDDSRYSAAP